MRAVVQGFAAGAPVAAPSDRSPNALRYPLFIPGADGSAPEVVTLYTTEPHPAWPADADFSRPLSIEIDIREINRADGGSFVSLRLLKVVAPERAQRSQ